MCCKTLIIGVIFVGVAIAGPAEDANKTTPEILATYGYPHEQHYVTTDDSYLLSISRVPRGKNDIEGRNRDVVLITHGLFGSDLDFLLLGAENALGYMLADAGYDVWMMNCRGTHMNYTVDNHHPTFWNYSMHELGVYDLPNTIDYILGVTGRKQLIHIGHSQGGGIFYIMLSERPEYNQKVKLHFSYAPAVYLCHATSTMLKNTCTPEENGTFSGMLRRAGGSVNIAPTLKAMWNIFNLCKDSPEDVDWCGDLYNFMANLMSNRTQFDRTLLPLVLAQYPGNTAGKQLVHFAQFINKCNFAKYREYPGDELALYNLTNVQVPIYCFHGDYDNTISPEDIILLEKSLPNGFVKRIKIKRFAHMDFIVGTGARKSLNEKTLNILNNLR